MPWYRKSKLFKHIMSRSSSKLVLTAAIIDRGRKPAKGGALPSTLMVSMQARGSADENRHMSYPPALHVAVHPGPTFKMDGLAFVWNSRTHRFTLSNSNLCH